MSKNELIEQLRNASLAMEFLPIGTPDFAKCRALYLTAASRLRSQHGMTMSEVLMHAGLDTTQYAIKKERSA